MFRGGCLQGIKTSLLYAKKRKPPDKLVYIDETGIDSYVHRPYAWARRGSVVYEKISGRRYKRVGIAAALCCGKIIEPMQYDGTMNSELFESWFKRI